MHQESGFRNRRKKCRTVVSKNVEPPYLNLATPLKFYQISTAVFNLSLNLMLYKKGFIKILIFTVAAYYVSLLNHDLFEENFSLFKCFVYLCGLRISDLLKPNSAVEFELRWFDIFKCGGSTYKICLYEIIKITNSQKRNKKSEK